MRVEGDERGDVDDGVTGSPLADAGTNTLPGIAASRVLDVIATAGLALGRPTTAWTAAWPKAVISRHTLALAC